MSRPPQLYGCWEKIKRANEHIREFHDDIIVRRRVPFTENAIVAQRHLEIGDPNDPSTWELEQFIFTLANTPPPVSLGFTILAGEAVHHLRSVLDHLVYQLVIAHTKKPPCFNSAFPIVGKGRMKKKVWVPAADEYKAQTSRLKQDITPSAEALIYNLQPFKRGATFHEDPLWQLTELDNAYKHQLLMLTVQGVSLYEVVVTDASGRTARDTFTPSVKFEHGTEIGRLNITGFDAEVRVDGDLILNVAFDKVGRRKLVPVIPHLAQLAAYVMRVVDSFNEEF